MLKYRPEIDGLRAIAVLAVIFYHAQFLIFGFDPFRGGYIGVDIFFVISGYLITLIILKGFTQKGFSFLEFYERRARRLLPVLFTVMISSIPFAFYYMLPKALKEYAASIFTSLFFSSNFWFWLEDSYWAGPSELKPFLHTWSLSVEEQFYLIFPALLILLWKFGRHHIFSAFITLGIASLVFAQFYTPSHPEFTFFLLPARGWELIAGALLAKAEFTYGRNPDYKHSRIACFTGLILILASVVLFTKETLHPSLITALPIIGTMLIIWFANARDFTTRLLSHKSMVGIGLISYGFYLWHYPVFAFARMRDPVPSQIEKIEWILISLALTLLTYFYIEKPARNRQKLAARPLMSALAVIFVLLAAGSAYLYKSDGFSHRYAAFLPTNFDLTRGGEGLENHVVYNSASNAPAIILIGDSHMEMLSTGLKNYADENDMPYAQSVADGCQFILNLDRVNKKTGKTKKCTSAEQAARLEFLKAHPNSIIIVGGRLPLWMEEDRFNNEEGGYEGALSDILQYPDGTLDTIEKRRAAIAAEYQKTIDALSELGNDIILVYPIPEVGLDVPNVIMEQMRGNAFGKSEKAELKPVTTSNDVYLRRTKRAFDVLDKIQAPNLHRVYPHKFFCDRHMPARCVTHDADNLYYVDHNHLSLAGAARVNAYIIEKIENITR